MSVFNKFFAQLDLSYFSIPNISVSTFIDIFAVAVVVYTILIWIKETRAWSLLKGILIVLFISAISVLFNLYTLSWIIGKTYNVGIIAIIVLFTPEIRKALEQIGSNRRMSTFFSKDIQYNKISPNSLDSIISACLTMARIRTGALIVIENNVPIGDIAETGVKINGDISYQLLVNIFEDKTPLHDGAIVIRSNKITSACCILPLTKNEIGKELGTRHRAAVGVSEVCDAYTIVVSEETGKISLAHSGKLYKDLTEEKIRNFIRFGDFGGNNGKI